MIHSAQAILFLRHFDCVVIDVYNSCIFLAGRFISQVHRKLNSLWSEVSNNNTAMSVPTHATLGLQGGGGGARAGLDETQIGKVIG